MCFGQGAAATDRRQPSARGGRVHLKLGPSSPNLGNNATVNPLDDYSYTPPYTSPIYHYYFPIINTSIGITITLSIISKVALLLKRGKGFLIEFGSGFRVKG